MVENTVANQENIFATNSGLKPASDNQCFLTKIKGRGYNEVSCCYSSSMRVPNKKSSPTGVRGCILVDKKIAPSASGSCDAIGFYLVASVSYVFPIHSSMFPIGTDLFPNGMVYAVGYRLLFSFRDEKPLPAHLHHSHETRVSEYLQELFP